MENQPSVESKPSLVGRLTNFVKEKKNEVVEKYGGSDWRTSNEILQAHGAFIVGTTLAVGLGVMGGMPEMGNIAFMPKVVGASIGVASIGAECWAMFKLWAVNEKNKLKTTKS